jgi:hypothetical protein
LEGRLGEAAAQEDKAIQYRSAKKGGANLMIPKCLHEKRPRILRKVMSISAAIPSTNTIPGVGFADTIHRINALRR